MIAMKGSLIYLQENKKKVIEPVNHNSSVVPEYRRVINDSSKKLEDDDILNNIKRLDEIKKHKVDSWQSLSCEELELLQKSELEYILYNIYFKVFYGNSVDILAAFNRIETYPKCYLIDIINSYRCAICRKINSKCC
jgi:hypothetical protein